MSKHGETVHLGKAKVQNHRVVRFGSSQELAPLAVRRVIDGIPRLPQRSAKLFRQLKFVFNDQNLHGALNSKLITLNSELLTVAEQPLHGLFSRRRVASVSMTFKAVFLAAAGLVGAGAVAIHLFAPELMHHLAQVIHGGR